MCAEDREALALSSLEATAQVFTESGVIFHWPAERWQRLTVSIDGASLIEDALGQGRGVLVLVPHLGNWEYLSLYLGKFAVTALYDPPRLRALDAPILRARSRTGAILLPISSQGIRAVYETLTHAGVVALLPDQVPDRRAGVYAEFFGKPALTMTFAHRLIARTRPVVLMGAAVRVKGGFSLRFIKADADLHTGNAVQAATAMNRSIQRLVCETPEQYQWEYKRFKRPPPGEPDCYLQVAPSG